MNKLLVRAGACACAGSVIGTLLLHFLRDGGGGGGYIQVR